MFSQVPKDTIAVISVLALIVMSLQVVNTYRNLYSFGKAIGVAICDYLLTIYVFYVVITQWGQPFNIGVACLLTAMVWHLSRSVLMGKDKYLAVGSIIMSIFNIAFIVYFCASRVIYLNG